jgi:predicted patatin/cPLA2 family phospholipase
MRVAYALGVLSVLQRSPLRARVGSIYTSSAGFIAALGFVGSDLDEFTGALLPKLAGHRFINSRRPWKVVDVDYLVDDVVIPLLETKRLSDPGAPPMIVSAVDENVGTVRHFRATAENAGALLRATMAIPVLYGRSVTYEGRSYVDGGVSDPIPIAEAAHTGSGGLIAVVLTKNLTAEARGPRGKERLAISLDPRIKPLVRHLLLSRSPLGAQAERWIGDGRVGEKEIVTVTPSDQSRVVSRTCTDVARLTAFLDLGRTDAGAFASAIEDQLSR